VDSTALDLVVTGRVQGVFFRAAMREQAQHLGVTGWARNEPDGTVRAHVEGPTEALERLLEWCAVGPPAARVEEVRQRSSEARGATSFDVS
jgi:acylphosphatase